LSLVAAIILGILTGIWTPVEAAAIAVVIVAAMGFFRGRLSIRKLIEATTDAVITSASVFIIVIGSMVFSNFLALNGFSEFITGWIQSLQLSSLSLFLVLVLLYIVIGMFMEVS